MPMSRPERGPAARVVCGLAGACLLVLAMALPGLPAAGAAPDTVRVAFTPFLSNSGLFIAEREGYFAAERIKIAWVPFTSGQSVIPVLAQGMLDVGTGGVSAGFFNAISRGQKIRVVAGMGHGAGRGSLGYLVVRKDLAGSVKSVADLKGRKIAFNGIGTLGHYFVAKTLATGGLSLDHVTAVIMPFPAAVAALQRGAVDATLLNSPFDAEAVELGAGFRLIDLAEVMPGEPTNFISFGPTLLEQNRALGSRFMVAYLRGAKRYTEGPTPRNVAIFSEYTKLDPAVVRKGAWISVYADGFVDAVRLRRYQDWLFEIGLINVRHPIPAVVDTGFVEEARPAPGIPGR